MTEVISNERVEATLRPDDAYTAVRQSFLHLANGSAFNEPRHRTPLKEGSFNVMWAVSDPLDAIALKAYPVIRSDVRQAAAIYVSLYSKTTGKLTGTVRGDSLGQRRTGAASVVAAELMARPNPEVLTVFGTGFQARGQVDAFLHHYPTIQQVCLVGRNTHAAERLASETLQRFPHVSVEITSAKDGTTRADLLVTATGSAEPLIDGDWLREGTHISAVGSNHAASSEIDLRTLERCALITVDSKATAVREGGDLLVNGFRPEDAFEIADVILGRVGRTSDSDITLFDSHGLAVQDLYLAETVLGRIRESTNGVDPAGLEERHQL